MSEDRKLILRAHARHKHDDKPVSECPACRRFATFDPHDTLAPGWEPNGGWGDRRRIAKGEKDQ